MTKRLQRKRTTRKHLKSFFVAHHGNNHRPYLIRPVALAVAALAVFALQSVPVRTLSSQPGQVLAYATDLTPVELLKDTNQERAKVGLTPLKLDARLNASAAAKAGRGAACVSAKRGITSFEPWVWFKQNSYNYSYAGENLAKDFDTAAGTMQGWMNSTSHRENVLNKNYTSIGIAVADGMLLGQPTTLVVAHYGTPAPEIAPNIAHAIPTPLASTLRPQPKATPAPTVAPLVESAPAQIRHYSLFHPLPASKTLTINSQMSLALLLLILITMLFSHFTVWRKRVIHGLTHSYKLRASTEMAMIGVGIIVIIVRSFGSIS